MFKRIWQWFKNIISKALAFFGFKASTKSGTDKTNNSTASNQENVQDRSIDVSKPGIDTTCEQKGSITSSKAEDGVGHIIDTIDPENIEFSKELFTDPNNQGWYDSSGILFSLFDLFLDSCCSKEKPVILVQELNPGQVSVSEEFKKISKLYNDRNVLYIRLQPTETPGKDLGHWIIFYFFRENKQNRLLFIDSLNQKRGSGDIQKILASFLGEQNYSLHVSTTKIQQDGYSCGLIASEVARMIYLNRVDVGKINDDFIEIRDFLPKNEFNLLVTSCRKKGRATYGGKEYSLNASDFRAAHVSVAQRFEFAGNLLASGSPRQISIGEILNGRQIDSDEIRKLVKQYGIAEESKKVIEEIKMIRENFIGKEDNAEEFFQGTKELYQANEDNKIQNECNQKKDLTQLALGPKKLDQSRVKSIELNRAIRVAEYNTKSS